MHRKTILNRVQSFKSFAYHTVRWVEDASEPRIEAELRPQGNMKFQKPKLPLSIN